MFKYINTIYPVRHLHVGNTPETMPSGTQTRAWIEREAWSDVHPQLKTPAVSQRLYQTRHNFTHDPQQYEEYVFGGHRINQTLSKQERTPLIESTAQPTHMVPNENLSKSY